MIKYFDKMKKILSILVVLLLAVSAFAQNPKLSYQAVVRDSENKLVVEQPVTMTVNVLKTDNTSQFEQTLNATTNRNGLMSLEIGNDTPAWNNIDWTGAKIRTAITLSSGAEVVDTTVVNAVPFALYANSVNTNAIPQSDWAETSNNSCTYIRNKPSISDTVNRILTDGNYVTTTMIDARGYLTADTLNAYTTTDQLCNVIVNNCTQLATDNELQNAVDTLVGISTLTALINELQTLTDQVGTMSEKINTLEKTIDSLTTFHCGIDKVKDHQDNEYKTTKIGNQCWMAQNLRCTTSPSRNNLELATGSESSTSTSYYYKIESFGNEGYLYNWRAALDTNVDVSTFNTPVVNRRGLCPEGWHLPTMDELNTLFSNGNAGQFAAPNGSYTGTDWSGSTNCTNGYPNCTDYPSRNSTGFSAVPVGYISGSYRGAGDYAQFWSSTTSNTYANVKFLYTDMGSADNGSDSKSGGNSIRCVRDVESVYISGSTPSVNMSVTTDSAKVNGNNLELYGNVTNLGGNASVNAGFEYRRGVGGTIYSTTPSDVTTTGSFSKTLNGTNFILYRAFVSDGSNKVYGSWKSYTPTLPHIVDPIE